MKQPLFAMQDNIVVTAAVLPLRIIVVDQNQTIIKITSNTKEDVAPKVTLGDENGKELVYNEAIQKQYLSLKPSLDLTKPGIFYPQENNRIKIAEWLNLFF